MKLPKLFPSLVVASLLGNLQAQQVDIPEIKHNAVGCSIDWMSKDGRSYFLQYSQDMENWQFMPSIRSGDGSMLSTGFQCNSPEFFLRLNWTDLPDGGDPNTADFDLDGLDSLEELQASPQTSPLLYDTDGDLLSDGQEKALNLNATLQDTDGNGILDSSEDPDGDGLSTLFELTNSIPTNPMSADSDGDELNDNIELLLQLDPNAKDSDNDGTLDSEEDTDDDGVSNIVEQNSGSNPNNGGDLGVPPTASLDEFSYEIQFAQITTNIREFTFDINERNAFPAGLDYSYQAQNGVNSSGTVYLPVNPSIGLLESQVSHFFNDTSNTWFISNHVQALSSSGHHTANPLKPIPGSDFEQVVTSHYNRRKFRLTRTKPEAYPFQKSFVEVIEESPGFTTTGGERQDVSTEVKSFTLTIPAGGTKSSPYTIAATLKTEFETTSRLLSVEVVDKDKRAISELKVAKWEDAFLGGHNNGSVKDEFIESDVDRFYIRIPGAGSLTNVKIEVATEDNPDSRYNDDPTEIELIKDGNDLISKSMILVSDDDDDFAGSGAGADDQLNDRTHKVQLEGKFVIKSITVNGAKSELDMKVSVPAKKRVDVDFYRMNVTGVHSEARIREAIRFIQERYAQCALKINANYKTAEWPQFLIDHGNDPGIFSIYHPDLTLTDNYKQFVDEVDQQGVNVIYCLSVIQSAGVAISFRQIAREGLEGLNLKYINNAFVNIGGGRATAAHELLHLLSPHPTRSDHAEAYYNLLVTSAQNINQNPVLWRKRINAEQQTRIYNHVEVKNAP